MSKATTPPPASTEAEVEEINFDQSPQVADLNSSASLESPATQGTVDINALLGGGDDANWDVNALLGQSDPELIPHEADPHFAPDAVDVSSESPFASWLGRNTDTDTETDEGSATPVVAETASTPDPVDPEIAEIARGLGLSPEELLGGTPPADPPSPEVAPEPSPEVAALTAQLEAMRAQIEELSQQQTQAQVLEAQTEALAAQEAQAAADRANYEAAQRTAYEEQYEYLDEDSRAEIVEALVGADLVRWDSQVSQSLAQARAQAQAQQEAAAQREAGYVAATAALVASNPTLAGELAPGYQMADFLADTHRAACDAYGMDAIGAFEPYAKAFESGLKTVQTKAFQAGIAFAQARAAKGAAAPPVLSNKGGGGAPATPKAGPEKLDLNNINFFAPEGKATRR